MTALASKSSLAVRRLVPGCCESCGRQFFYRRTGRPRNFCDQKCRQSDFRRSGYTSSKISKIDESALKNEVNSGTFGRDSGDRLLRVVAGQLSPSALHFASVDAAGVIEANNRLNAKYWREYNVKAEATRLIKRHSPPVNIVGGYKFPNAPAIDLVPRPNQPTPAQLQRLLLSQIPHDLSIPPFLCRDSQGRALGPIGAALDLLLTNERTEK